MKKSLLTFAFITSLMISGLFAAADISPRLSDALANAIETNTTVQALIVLQDQVDIIALDNQLYDTKASLKERAYTVITTLQAKADATQSGLLEYLSKKYEDEVIQFKSFWITNMVMVEAQPSILIEIAERSDVSYLDLDAELQRDKPVSSAPAAAKSPNGHEIGLERINAHLMWMAGFTGAGRIVMNDYIGVDCNHPALNYKWRGAQPGVPASAAWYSWNGSSTFPVDGDTHGTHTMGTMCGLDPATNDTVGVAPGAQWIASNALMAGSHTSQSIDAWQWATDPDGNPSTIDDMPDAITNSWYDPSISTSAECDAALNPYINAHLGVEATGIAIVFSAGNSGPSAASITQPKNVNLDEVTFWATGAVNGNDPTLPIASFSSRGPVQSYCTTGTTSLDIKPEASAPGYQVRSSVPGAGYSTMNGTSMACPHVAGAIALLREAHPGITGKEAKYALYSAAVDLGVPGEDNTYGMGIIDVWAAYLSLADPGDPVMVVAPTAVYDTLIVGTTGTDNITVYNNQILPSSLNYSITESPAVAWLEVNPSSGTILTHDNDVLDLNFDAIVVTTGSYYTELIIAGDDPNNPEDIVDVYLEVLDAPAISLNPTSFSKSLSPGEVEVDTLTIRNTGLSDLHFDLIIEEVTLKNSSTNIPPIAFSGSNSTSGMSDLEMDQSGAIIEGLIINNIPAGYPRRLYHLESSTPDLMYYKFDEVGTSTTQNYANPATRVNTSATLMGAMSMGGSGQTGAALIGSGGSSNSDYVNTNWATNLGTGDWAISLWLNNMDMSTNLHYHFGDNTATSFRCFSGGVAGAGNLLLRGPVTDVLVSGVGPGPVVVDFIYDSAVPEVTAYIDGILNNVVPQSGVTVVGSGPFKIGGYSTSTGLASGELLDEFKMWNSIPTDFTWLAADTHSGVITPSSSMDVILTFDATDLSDGDYSANITVNSNDPDDPSIILPATLNVTSKLLADIKVFLEGPYSGGSMNTYLQSTGLLPLAQPYTIAPWNYSGTESVSSVPSGVVDWILVELRTNTEVSTKVATRAGFLKSDGTLTDTDGLSPLSFENVANGDYHIVVYHRNHLALMSLNPVPLSTSEANSYNFTDDINSAYTTGPVPMTELETDVYGMVSGDGNSDNGVDAVDQNTIWIPTNGTPWDYNKYGDYNLDGGIDAIDYNLHWISNNGRASQVPLDDGVTSRVPDPTIGKKKSIPIQKSVKKDDSSLKKKDKLINETMPQRKSKIIRN